MLAVYPLGRLTRFQKRREDARERAKEVRAALATDPKVRTLEELERQLLTLAEPFTTRDEELDEQVTAITGDQRRTGTAESD